MCGKLKSPTFDAECSQSTGPACGDMTTCEPSRPLASGIATSLPAETHAKRTVELESRQERERRLSALNSSALLMNFARDLFSARIPRESAPMLPGLGGDFGPVLNALATLCCPSDSEPVALALSISATGCSCLPSIPTPTASQIGCRDVPRMLARRERCREKHGNGNGFGLTFYQWFAVKHFTPTASDWKGSTGKGSRRNTFSEQVAINEGPNNGTTCYPHPEFVEAVMMFPITWSELAPLETPLCRPLPSTSAVES